MNRQEIKNIKLGAIQLNPNNPRKAINEQSINELAESIKAMGVLQPIIVSHLGRVANEANSCIFQIVCGERRFRASQKAGVETIPAIVRNDLSKSEFMEMALTENLLREDVTPLEEMEIYAKLIEECDYSIEKLMGRFGKSESYIRNRTRLANLIEEYHPLLLAEELSLGVALELCKYSKEIQAEVYDNHFAEEGDFHSWRGKTAKAIIENLERSYSNDLEDYFFDKAECQSCSFNSQAISLFADEDICGRCTNRQCLKAKNTAYIVERAIDTHERNPELPLARNAYRYDKSAIEELTAKGYDIRVVDWCRECPTSPSEDDFESNEAYQAEYSEFMEDTAEISEKYKRGEVEIYALIGTRGVTLSYRSANRNSPNGTAETPLDKLRSQDKRNKEIATEKSIAEIKDLVKGLDVTQGDFSAFEEQITYFAMAKALRSEHFAMVGFDDKHYLTDEDRWTLVYNLTDEKRTIIKRDYIVSTLSDAQRGNYTAVMLLGYAEQHAEERVKEIQETHNEVYEKRHERIEEKIAAIEKLEL